MAKHQGQLVTLFYHESHAHSDSGHPAAVVVMSAMRLANTLAACAVTVWLGLLLVGRALLLGIPGQHVVGYPSAAQIDHYVVLPASVLIVLLFTAAIINRVQRFAVGLVYLSGFSLIGAAGYFLTLSGGI